MPILTSLLFAIGPAVGKALLKTLLKDYPVLEDLAPDLLDQLKDQTPDSREERQKADQIAPIGETIATRIRPLFDAAHIDDGERAAVVREVLRTLNGANAELLVRTRLYRQQVEQALTHAHPEATVGFSEAAKELYRRMMQEASQALVGVAAELVGYASVRDAYLLQDQAKLIELVANLVRRPDEESERFEVRYREVIGRELNQLEMFGVPRLKDAVRRQKLSIAYVTAEVKRIGQSSDNEPDRDFLEALLEDAPQNIEDERHNASGPIDQILARERRIVVCGEPGSGKTTLLQWIAIKAASQTFEGPLKLWNNTVPFFIRLRKVTNNGFPMPEEYIAQIAHHIAGSRPYNGWEHDQLDNGRAVVLIDGVDELPQGKRESFFQELQALLRDFPHARYIITSRPVVVSKRVWPDWHEWIQKVGFAEVTIQPMNHGAIEQFINLWHKAYAEGTQDPDERGEVYRAAPHLKQLLPQRPGLRQVASNPLLCAMICALHLDRRNTLPSERIKLYEECIDMLLEQRDAGRQIDMNDYPQLGNRQKLTLLRDLAYRMLRLGESVRPVELVDQRFADFLPRLGTDQSEAAKVRAYFVQRSGLLREPIEGYLDFAHRTFQEFFTACEMAEDGEVNVLLQQADDDQWRETITLAAGKLRRREVEQLLRGLIVPGASLPRRTLALACLETVVDVDQALEKAIFAAVPELFPPYRREQQQFVAAAGERGIAYLQPEQQPNIAANVVWVRTLALIGGDKALAAIKRHATLRHKRIDQAVNAAWSSFDIFAYAQQMLAERTALNIDEPALLDTLRYLPQLQQLDLYETGMTNLNLLTELPQLQQLTLYETELTDLRPLLNYISCSNSPSTRSGKRISVH